MYEDIYQMTMQEGRPAFRLPAWVSCAPFEEYLGITIEHAAEGRALLALPFKAKLAQGAGLMHGGALTALADTAVAIAIKTILPEGSDFVTVEMNMKLTAAVHEGVVRAEARAVPQDERKIVGEAEIFCGERRVASFKALFIVKKRG